MTEREWMSFDNEFKSLMDELSLIAGYNGLLTQMCDSASLEQLDAAMMTEHVELQAKAKTVWNSWHFVEDRSHITGKKLSHVKYSSKRSGYLSFYSYLCHVIDDFCLS